ncbi:MAG: hypothetical protein HRU24_02745 [Gammaproteobacteria bacterium]|nr:hypothetical protein [Gammaproteobacteria bacterium]
MDDETLAPFVDALASALIVMVLVSIFFMIQTASSVANLAKLYTVNIDIQAPLLSRIVYREIISHDIDSQEFTYLVNFEMDPKLLEEIKSNIGLPVSLTITVESNDAQQKSVVNLIRFLKYLALPGDVKITTNLKESNSMLSKIKWEIN